VGWTSGDAAGLAIFPALSATTKLQLVRSTMPSASRCRIQGATTTADTLLSLRAMPRNFIYQPECDGMRIRLKASFDISGYSAANQVILTAMKKYGMILADNGAISFFRVVDSRGR